MSESVPTAQVKHVTFAKNPETSPARAGVFWNRPVRTDKCPVMQDVAANPLRNDNSEEIPLHARIGGDAQSQQSAPIVAENPSEDDASASQPNGETKSRVERSIESTNNFPAKVKDGTVQIPGKGRSQMNEHADKNVKGCKKLPFSICGYVRLACEFALKVSKATRRVVFSLLVDLIKIALFVAKCLFLAVACILYYTIAWPCGLLKTPLIKALNVILAGINALALWLIHTDPIPLPPPDKSKEIADDSDGKAADANRRWWNFWLWRQRSVELPPAPVIV